MLNSSRRWFGIAAVSVVLNAALAGVLFRMGRRANQLTTAREKATLDLQEAAAGPSQFAPQRIARIS